MKASCYFIIFLTCYLGMFELVSSGGEDHFHDCSLPPDDGYDCSGDMSSSVEPIIYYYYDVFDQLCYPSTYYGCGGNSNRFGSQDVCETYCLKQGDARPL